MTDQSIEALQGLYKLVLEQEKNNALIEAFSTPRDRQLKMIINVVHREIKRLYRLHASPIGHLPGPTSHD